MKDINTLGEHSDYLVDNYPDPSATTDVIAPAPSRETKITFTARLAPPEPLHFIPDDQYLIDSEESMECPPDLMKAVNENPEFQWIIYDMGLMPEQITTKYEVCALRAAWMVYIAMTEIIKQRLEERLKE